MALAALSMASAAATPETHVLADGGLRAEIEVAADRLAAQFGPRFDRTASVRSVRLDGVELLGPWGLSDEFGLFGDGVLGYESAAVGETFLKIGVGRLVRDTPENYQFDHPYPVADLFPIETVTGAQSLTVIQRSPGEGPRQYLYRKSYELHAGNALTIRYELTNTGSVAWTFEHYNHHWFRLQDVPVGPGYAVATGFDLPAADTTLRHAPRMLEMPAPLTPGGAAYYAGDLQAVTADANTFSVRVNDAAVVQYQGDSTPHRFALYADADGFCPEVFVRAALEPGETTRWSATYRFRTN